jgi:hypothetical protein
MPSLPKATGAVALLGLALAACGSSHNSSSHSGSGVASSTHSGQSLAVSVTTPRSEPVAGGFWPITVRAHTASGTPVNGIVSYAFLFGGSVVARRPGGHMSGGVFHDRLEFTSQSVGYPLTVQVVVRGAEGESGTTERPVSIRK